MAAIEKAKQILAERVTVLIQVRSKSRTDDYASAQDRNTLRKVRASLAILNLVTVATQDPMENVKNLLKELITKLEKEAAEAASLHAFCQEEKNKTKAALEKKDMDLEKLSTRIEKATATKKEQEELIADNSEEIAALDKSVAEATKLRNEQHEQFVKVDTDFTQAAEAVDDAIDALKEFYGDAFFLQTDSETQTTSTSNDDQPKFG